jgi:hypothetical protein
MSYVAYVSTSRASLYDPSRISGACCTLLESPSSQDSKARNRSSFRLLSKELWPK